VPTLHVERVIDRPTPWPRRWPAGGEPSAPASEPPGAARLAAPLGELGHGKLAGSAGTSALRSLPAGACWRSAGAACDSQQLAELLGFSSLVLGAFPPAAPGQR
jgi:hypothetical protein